MSSPAPENRLSPRERVSTFSLAGIYALRMLGLFLVMPVLSVLAAGLEGGSDPEKVGLALGIYGLTQAVLLTPLGMLSDRYGRKPVILAGMLAFAAGSLVCALSGDIWTLIAGRALQGAGAVSAAVTAFLADSIRPHLLTRSMAVVGSSIGLMFALSVAVAPALADWVGLSGLFTIVLVLTLSACAVLVWLVPPAPQRLRERSALAQPFWKVLFDLQLARLHCGVFVLHFALMALFVSLPARLTFLGTPLLEHWHLYLPAVLVSFALMMPGILLAERAGRMKPVITGAIALLAAVYAGFAFFDSSLATIGVLLPLFFTGFNLLEATLASLVARLAPPADKGMAIGIFNTMQSLGLFSGGAVGGWLASHFGEYGEYGLHAVGWTCCCLMAAWLLAASGMKMPARHGSEAHRKR